MTVKIGISWNINITNPAQPKAPGADDPGTVLCAAPQESVEEARAARRQALVAPAPVVGPRACRPPGTKLWETL